jgi:hypothetical protein
MSTIVAASPASLKLFVSYKRNVEPDEPLARQIVAALTSRGHDVFIDQRLQIGQEWAKEIERRVRTSDYLIVLLTAASSASEMVRGEVEIARKAAEEPGGKPKILPVRVAFRDALPYPLRAYLDPIQYTCWDGPSDTAPLLQALDAVLAGQPAELRSDADLPAPSPSAQPSYAAVLPPPGGAIEIDDPMYVERDVDNPALALARQQGQTVVIKGPRQMGKSSLLMRVVSAGCDAGKSVALIDLQLADSRTRSEPERFFKWFCSSVAEQLQLEGSPLAAWDPEASPTQNSTSFFETQVLAKIPQPVMLAIDESDIAFKVPNGIDFFSMLRNWHGRRAHPIRKIWKRVDLVLVTAVDPDRLIDRDHESPFNVGVVYPLPDFSMTQLEALNSRHPRPLDSAGLKAIYMLVGGHPFLVRRALYLTGGAQSRMTVTDLVRSAADDMGPFGDHLRYYMLRISSKPQIVNGLRDVLNGRAIGDDFLAYRLQASGLLRKDGDRFVPRCDLYVTYLKSRLANG